MITITAPEETPQTTRPKLFLGGAISGAPDWQATLIGLLGNSCPQLILLNPRRASFPVCGGLEDNKKLGTEQILWEERNIMNSNAMTMWFCKETLGPICLFELGKMAALGHKLFVGCEPGYARDLDVRVQLGLMRSDIVVVDTLEALAGQVQQWYRTLGQSGPAAAPPAHPTAVSPASST
ncbi:hypothetical protein PAPYR_7819 [Paratrimastix pyriformis]|uniref:Nucleoside 2-deoxyribosyltransferase like n=1 Tax=Paratrimastix pyriformis TaxID=342808 RepID=A0ABQ8UFA5_9EUKA|nr:hypothetical protein PAPYR_7819 [Paratrimastix pyriformis]